MNNCTLLKYIINFMSITHSNRKLKLRNKRKNLVTSEEALFKEIWNYVEANNQLDMHQDDNSSN